MLLLTLAAAALTAASGPVTAPDPKSPGYLVIASTEPVLQKNYPQDSLRLGEQGIVQFRIQTRGSGDLGVCQVVGSSGYARLDTATCDLLIGKTLFKKVVRNGAAIKGERFGQINWILPPQVPTPATPPPKSNAVELAKASEAFMCHYSQKTGSLVTRTKQCMRRGDFETLNRLIEQDIDRLRMNSWQNTSN